MSCRRKSHLDGGRALDRVVLGVGVGWMEEEFALTGQEFRNRGRRTDEMIEVVGKLLSGKGASARRNPRSSLRPDDRTLSVLARRR